MGGVGGRGEIAEHSWNSSLFSSFPRSGGFSGGEGGDEDWEWGGEGDWHGKGGKDCRSDKLTFTA